MTDPLRQASKNRDAGPSVIGKYRAILLAIVAFLICDLTVMTLNLYSSTQARAHAVHINFARQFGGLVQSIARILSEMMAIDTAKGSPDPQLIEDLRSNTRQFDLLLAAFRDGGSVVDEAGNAFHISPLTSPEARQHLDDLAHSWGELRAGLAKVTEPQQYSVEDLEIAQLYAVTYLDQMAQVTTLVVNDAQAQSDAATRRVQLAQIIGFSLAMINFVYAIFMSMRSLISNDRRVAIVQKETDEILSTVREGLFLLDRDMKIGERVSASMREMFRIDVRPGADFLDILGQIVTPATLESARDYVDVLFGEHVMEEFAQSLNPLTEVETRVAGAAHRTRVQHLSFRFNRVIERGRISHLLVTVQDASVKVQLTQELEAANTRARADLEVYLRLLDKDPAQLNHFVATTQERLTAINAQLRAAAERGHENHTELLKATLRTVHAIKGDATGLGLDLFQALAHRIETELLGLRDRRALSGEDMIQVAVRLDEFFVKLSMLRGIVSRIAAITPLPDSAPASLAPVLRELGERVARAQNKNVRVIVDVEAFHKLPAQMSTLLNDVTVQLVRNAITHGIEPPEQRTRAGKPERGTVQVACLHEAGALELTVRDDGGGIQIERIREVLVTSGRYTAEQARQLAPREALMKLFEPGFSTKVEADMDAGRGIGLDIVHERVRAMGGRLRISSQPNQYTEFSLRLDAAGAIA